MANILVIDDEDYIRKIIRRILEEKNHNVTEASHGSEGIELIKKGQYDIVVIDLIMPKKGGIETIMELRNRYPELKFIIISGKIATHSNAFFNLINQFGVKHILYKPFKKKKFNNIIKELLES